MLEETKKYLSVVIPVFNEEESLPELLKRTGAACDSLGKSYEIILVDDGSSDDSARILEEAARLPGSNVVAVLLNRNYGQHSAIMAGFDQVEGEVVITLDADLQNPPEEIPRLVAAIEEGYDVVGTIRANRQDSFFRRKMSRIINLIIKKSTGKELGDYGCMLRAYKRIIVKAMLQCHERSTFIPILANSFARKTIDLPVAHNERQFGVSKYGLWQLINLMFDLVTCMTTMPIRLLSIAGGLIACTGFLLAFVLLLLRFAFGAEWAGGGVFTLFAVLFAFIGVQLVSMGLLGEYIGRIYGDVRARPRYFIQEIINKTNSNLE